MCFKKLFIFIALSSFTLPLNAQITVTSAGQQWKYEQPVRLETVLAPIVSSADIYWPAAALYQLPVADMEILRDKAIVMLGELAASVAEEQQIAMQQLAQEISKWHLAKRLPIKVDYDLARLDLAANPQLNAGEYLLLLPRRPDSVYIFGAIAGAAKKAAHQPIEPATYYLQNISRLGADRNEVFLLQRDGRAFMLPLTGSNKKRQELQPGSSVYVPFASTIFDRKYAELNHLIIELMQYRVEV